MIQNYKTQASKAYCFGVMELDSEGVAIARFAICWFKTKHDAQTFARINKDYYAICRAFL